jgi:ABC-type multidrug transport system fused ATPase/permease subunit
LNGAGKTTIIKLICRFYEPTEGQIYLNGTDIKEYSKESYQERISAVFQESKLFAFTLLENISLNFEELNEENFWPIIESVSMRKQIEGLT